MTTDEILRFEIQKWLNKIEPLAEKVVANNKKGDEMITNMKAYISDSKHFLAKGDLVRSFEAIVWAFSIYEICTKLKIIKGG